MKRETEILLSAAFVLTPEENWTQFAYGKTADGEEVWHTDARACRWCLDGALRLAGNEEPAVDAARHALWRATGHGAIAFNDNHTHGEVLDALYLAAEIAEAS